MIQGDFSLIRRRCYVVVLIDVDDRVGEDNP